MNINVARFGGAGFTPVPYGPPSIAAPARAAARPSYSPPPFRPSRLGQGMASDRALSVGTLLIGTGISATLGYFGIKAGLQEKGFLAVLGWVFGVPAAISTLIGAVSLADTLVGGERSTL